MKFARISGKVVSYQKIDRVIEEVFSLREQGFSQQEVASKLKIDRTFISRLEKMGEIRKGNTIAVIGFPILNKVELIELLNKYGVEFYIIMTEAERWDFVKTKSGIQLLNEVVSILAKVKAYETVIIIGSNQRIKIFEAIFDQQVVGIAIGESPIEEDKAVDISQLAEILAGIKV
ncbi:MAG: transcriptional regulator [Clostridia bacterium]|nr:transcriptional regulator [Clostridia bacterium]